MITADLHTHTSFSTDSSQPMEDAVLHMIGIGLKTVCFTEHMDMDYPGGEFLLDTVEYHETLLRLREKYSGKLEILFGVELGLMEKTGGVSPSQPRRRRPLPSTRPGPGSSTPRAGTTWPSLRCWA